MARKFKELMDPLMADPVRRARILAARQAMIDAMDIAERRNNDASLDTIVVNDSRSRLLNDCDAVYLSNLSYLAEELGGRLEVSFVFPDEKTSLLPRD